MRIIAQVNVKLSLVGKQCSVNGFDEKIRKVGDSNSWINDYIPFELIAIIRFYAKDDTILKHAH